MQVHTYTQRSKNNFWYFFEHCKPAGRQISEDSPQKFFFFTFTFYMHLCVYVYVVVEACCATACVKIRKQLSGVSFLLLPVGPGDQTQASVFTS